MTVYSTNQKSKNNIPALSTAYGGRIFGSRHKARWAVFMDLMGVEYYYRTETEFPSYGSWEPDFYLPKRGKYVHVTPQRSTLEDVERYERFVLEQLAALRITTLTVITGRIGVPQARYTDLGFEVNVPYSGTLYGIRDTEKSDDGTYWIPSDENGKLSRIEEPIMWCHCIACSVCSPCHQGFLGLIKHAPQCHVPEMLEQYIKEAEGVMNTDLTAVMAVATPELTKAYRTASSIKLDSWANLRVTAQ